MPSVMFGETKIDYSTKISLKRKTIGVTVDFENGVVVVLPKKMDQKRVDEVVLRKAPWILNQLHEFSEVVETPSEKEFVSGEKFLYLGRRYRLKVHKKDICDKPELTFHRGKFHITLNSEMSVKEQTNTVKELLKSWYLAQATRFLEERVSSLSKKTDTKPKEIQIKEQQKRWGSCSKEGVLNLNWKVIMAPVSVIDYIIIHELCHLKYPNHSEKFWKEVRIFCPDFQQRRDWLRKNGPELSF